MSPAPEEMSLAEGARHLEVPMRDLWLGVAGLGGDLSELEIEAYVLQVLSPDAHSHNLIAQALNEHALSCGGDHPVGYRAITRADVPTADATDDPVVGIDAPFDIPADIDPGTWSALDKLSRALHVRDSDLPQTLDAVLSSACRLIPGADAASLNLLVRGRLVPQTAVGDVPTELGCIQQATGTGPCIDASREQAMIESVDLSVETRWPAFAERAVALGVRSMLCAPLWVDDTRLGSLSLYCCSAEDGFDEQARSLAELLATHAALALADTQRVANLRQALVNRDVIGQAKGILMARHGLTADAAFTRLSSASQRLNMKLATVAETVSLTGELPGGGTTP